MDESTTPQSQYATPVPLGPEEVRAKIAATAAARGESLSSLSVAIGRNVAYLQQYIERGSPRVLPEDVRLALAQHWRIDERELGARDPWRPVGNGGVVDEMAASLWLRGTPDWPWEDAPKWWRTEFRAHVEVMLAVLARRGMLVDGAGPDTPAHEKNVYRCVTALASPGSSVYNIHIEGARR